MRNPLSTLFGAALLACVTFTAEAAELTVNNSSSEPVNLYFDDGHGWEFYQMIPASKQRRYQTEVGESWGIADPHQRGVRMIKDLTVRAWGTNTLSISNRDLGHAAGGIGGGARPGPDLNPLNNTINISNNSSIRVDVYADHGRGWVKEGTLDSRERRNFHAIRGDDWGIDDPNRRGVNIVKMTTVKNFDFLPALTVYDQDFGIINPPAFLPPKMITINNRSNHRVDVYVDHKTGGGWHKEGTVPPRESAKFRAETGEDWAVDNPEIRGVTAVKALRIRDFGINSITITEQDLHPGGSGVGGGGNPSPGNQERTIVMKNDSSKTVTIYNDDGRGWFRQGTLYSGSGKSFQAPVGEAWGFDDPLRSGVNIIKQGKVSGWSRSTTLTLTDRNLGIGGGGGGFPPIFNPQPRPQPQPAREVSITFKNKSIHKANVSVKTGPFSKSYLGTIGRLSKGTFKLKPGQTVVINRPGELGNLKYEVPNQNAYIEFKPK